VNKPSMVMGARTDPNTPWDLNMQPMFDGADRPKHLVEIVNGSHPGFAAFGQFVESQIPPEVPLDAAVCSFLAPVFAGRPNLEECNTCDLSVLQGPQMPSAQQLELAVGAVTAFFGTYLGCSQAGFGYLKTKMEDQNPELITTYRGPSKLKKNDCAAERIVSSIKFP